jgi:5-methylcytosine-specific restriction endonuclease McrA
MTTRAHNLARAALLRQLMLDVIRRDKTTCCSICGIETTLRPGYRRRTLDHIIPVSRGGTDTVENLRICCLSCNSSRGNRDVARLLLPREVRA